MCIYIYIPVPIGLSAPAIRDLDTRSATRDMADKRDRADRLVRKAESAIRGGSKIQMRKVVDRLEKKLQGVAEEIKVGKELLKKGTDDETWQKTKENLKDAKERRAKI